MREHPLTPEWRREHVEAGDRLLDEVQDDINHGRFLDMVALKIERAQAHYAAANVRIPAPAMGECTMTDDCDHLWVAGGLISDWICEHCGQRADIPDEHDEL